MGKPYWADLGNLQRTWDWANQVGIEDFQRVVHLSLASRLVSIGSGGSLSVATFASYIHNAFTGQGSEAVTPLQAAELRGVRDSAVYLFSAGGSNPDVLGICRRLIGAEPKALGVLCLRTGSPLGRLCRRYEFVGCSELSLPSGKDGFVATNSLLAFMILLQRAYRKCADAKAEDTLTFQQIVAGHKTLDGWMNDLREASAPLWKKEHLLVLYGSRAAEAAARDMESKFTEAAIGPIQITDYRNFAHGRHHWLDKKGAETGILAFIADSDAEIAAQTLKLLPAKIPRLKFNIACQTGYTGIKAMISSLFLSGFAAEARGIDPGRPRVATFGRKIYHLNIWNRSARKPLSAIEEVAIERKTGKRVELLAPAELAHWRGAFRQFMSGLRTRAFHALVLDYDGTICDEKYRFGALPIAMSLSLNRLLKDGALIGIATGRGDSVRDALRECLHPELWNRVTVAYRNGSTISNLDSDVSEPSDPDASRRIQELAKRLEQSYALNAIATSKCRSDQINVIARHPGDSTHVYNLVCSIAAADFGSGITCVRSSHSIDILGPNLSKAAIFHTLAKTISGRRSSLICIGDLGAWPGNDYQLLGAPYSLSVLEVSQDPATCWNIAPRGVRNSQATRFFLDQLECSRSIIRFGKSKGRTPQSEP